jgi:hypothetical protein
MKRSTDYKLKAKQMNLLMKQKLETYRKEIMLREFNGFEDCYNMFKDFYSDALKKTDDEQGDNREE